MSGIRWEAYVGNSRLELSQPRLAASKQNLFHWPGSSSTPELLSKLVAIGLGLYLGFTLKLNAFAPWAHNSALQAREWCPALRC